jgi:hypothetical protein
MAGKSDPNLWRTLLFTPGAEENEVACLNKERALRLLHLDALQVLDDGLDVVRTEHKYRHVGMSGDDAFGK